MLLWSADVTGQLVAAGNVSALCCRAWTLCQYNVESATPVREHSLHV